jgi:hypothetical protein
LDLLNNALSGTLPKEWSALANLQVRGSRPSRRHAGASTRLRRLTSDPGPCPAQELRLSENKLSGTLPSEWSALTSLQVRGSRPSRRLSS